MGLNVDVACLWVNSQVLEVATREGDVGNDLDLAIANLGDDDLVTEVADTALDLHAVVEELLEGGDIEDLVASGLRSVDDVLWKRNVSSRSPISDGQHVHALLAGCD
jgi:hypothetical protein